jgi:hypothetical protein
MITSYPDEPACQNKSRRKTNNHLYGIHYRVKAEICDVEVILNQAFPTPEIDTDSHVLYHLEESKFKNPEEKSIIEMGSPILTELPYQVKTENVGIKLYKVKDGVETIIRKEDM